MDPACWEIAGHIVMKRQQDYDTASQESAWHLLSCASYDPANFARVTEISINAAKEAMRGRKLATAFRY